MKFGGVFVDLYEALNVSSRPWYLFGAQAAIVYGLSRSTVDIDVTVFIKTGDLIKFLEEMNDHDFEHQLELEEAKIVRVMPFVHRKTGIGIDVVLGGPGLEAIFLERVQYVPIHNVDIPIASIEDLIVMKILAGRVKDIEDAKVLIPHAEDFEHIKSLLNALNEGLDRSDLVSMFETLI